MPRAQRTLRALNFSGEFFILAARMRMRRAANHLVLGSSDWKLDASQDPVAGEI